MRSTQKTRCWLAKAVPRAGLWRHRQFAPLWAAQSISQIGSNVTLLALPLAAVLVLHATAFQIAVLGVAEFIPVVLVSLPAGVWVDRFPRRAILIVADLARALLLASIPIAYATGNLTLWLLYVVGIFSGTFSILFDVAFQTHLPSIVDPPDLLEANAKLEFSRSAARLIGPGLAGVLVAAIGAPYAILVDAASFVASAAIVSATRTRRAELRPVPPTPASSKMFEGISAGLRYILSHHYWRPLALATGGSNFFTNVTFSIFIVFLVRHLRMSSDAIGLVFAIGNVGFVTGAVTARRVIARIGVGAAISRSSLLLGLPLLLVPVAPKSFPVPVLAAVMAIGGFGYIVFNVSTATLYQTLVPAEMLARVNASRRLIVWGTIPLGAVAGGLIGSRVGLTTAIWVGAIGATVAALPIFASPVRSAVLPSPKESQ
jgi:MFS family permease